MKHLISRLLKSKMKNDDSSLKSPLFRYVVSGGISFFLFLMVIVVFCVILFGPIMIANEYIDSFKSSASSFFEKVGNLVTFRGWCTDEECARNSEQLYQEKLKEVYDSYKEDGVEIDIDLITATVYYHSSFEDKFSDVEDDDSFELTDDINVSDVKKLASNMVSGSTVDYNKYRNYLVSTYIPKRFSDLYKTDKEKEDIADEIMMYAQKEYVKGNGYGLNPIYKECSQVCPSDGSRCLDLEEFVVRVVDHESGPMDGVTEKGYIEEWKAQAVAARTATLFMTNSCTKPIELGTNINILDPNSSRSNHDKIKEVIKDTAGQILTIDGKPITASWDSFYKGNNYHCDDSLCYSTYTKIGLTWEGETHEIASYKEWESKFLGGHGKGLSQYGAAYLADIGWNYKDILKYYYDDKTELSTLTTISSGTMSGTIYTSNSPMYNNSIQFFGNINGNYFNLNASNYGECPWYAKGRAIEIIANSNMPDDLKQRAISTLRSTLGNGRAWYSNTPTDLFSRSNDLYAAKPGAIVSWSGGKVCKFDPTGYCGHVGIVEDVEYDSSGRAVKVLMSEGWNNYDEHGRKLGAAYSLKWWNIEKFKSYYSRAGKTYYFNGYVYLLG